MTSIPSGFDDTKLSSQNRLIRKGINLSSDRLAGIRARANESLTHYGVANKKIVNSIINKLLLSNFILKMRIRSTTIYAENFEDFMKVISIYIN